MAGPESHAVQRFINRISDSCTGVMILHRYLMVSYLLAIPKKREEEGIIHFQVPDKVNLILPNLHKTLRIILGGNGVGEADAESTAAGLAVNHKEIMIKLVRFNHFFSCILKFVLENKTIAL